MSRSSTDSEPLARLLQSPPDSMSGPPPAQGRSSPMSHSSLSAPRSVDRGAPFRSATDLPPSNARRSRSATRSMTGPVTQTTHTFVDVVRPKSKTTATVALPPVTTGYGQQGAAMSHAKGLGIEGPSSCRHPAPAASIMLDPNASSFVPASSTTTGGAGGHNKGAMQRGSSPAPSMLDQATQYFARPAPPSQMRSARPKAFEYEAGGMSLRSGSVTRRQPLCRTKPTKRAISRERNDERSVGRSADLESMISEPAEEKVESWLGNSPGSQTIPKAQNIETRPKKSVTMTQPEESLVSPSVRSSRMSVTSSQLQGIVQKQVEAAQIEARNQMENRIKAQQAEIKNQMSEMLKQCLGEINERGKPESSPDRVHEPTQLTYSASTELGRDRRCLGAGNPQPQCEGLMNGHHDPELAADYMACSQGSDMAAPLYRWSPIMLNNITPFSDSLHPKIALLIPQIRKVRCLRRLAGVPQVSTNLS